MHDAPSRVDRMPLDGKDIAIVIPAMGFVTFVCWAIWRSLPEPRYLAAPQADLPPTP